MADPDLKSVELVRSDHAGDRLFGIQVIADARSDSLDGFTLIIAREESVLRHTPLIVPVTVPPTRITLRQNPGLHSVDVVHVRRGIVYSDPAGVFAEGITLEENLITQHRKVQVPARGRRDDETYNVPLLREPARATHAIYETGAQVLASNVYRREHRRDPYQQWFSGALGEATDRLRKLMGATEHLVLLVDPYLDAVDFARFALAVPRTSALIRLLTSSAGLVQSARQAGLPPGEHLAQALAQAPSAQAHIEIRVMLGDKSPVHDRFLIVDDAGWLFGSSLNEFGSRGSMLVALPAPYEVLPELEQAWAKAQPLDAWVHNRQKLSPA